MKPRNKANLANEDILMQPIQVIAKPVIFDYSANLWDVIVSPNQFADIIFTLENMSENDQFKLNLSSVGGSLSATDTLIHAMRNCKGLIHVTATGEIASAATLILLEAHSYELSDNFCALLHCGSLNHGGTLSEVKQSSNFVNTWMENYIKDSYKHFLTDKEIQSMLDGKDMWLSRQDFLDRLIKRDNLRKKAFNKLVKQTTPRKPKKQVSEVTPEELMPL